MKAKYIGILSLALLSIFGCDDNTGTLGMGMLPDSDGLSAHTASFDVTTYSVEAEQVFSKTSTGYIGRFTDPDFGYYESSFLSELNCTDDYTFPSVYKESADGTSGTGMMAGDTVVSVSLVLYYKSWFGDSLNACRMSVYELNDEWLNDRKTADNYRYTDFDITKYYDPNKLLGRKAYSAYDATIPDSVRNATDSYGNSIYYPYVAFRLDKEQYGNRILQLNRECRMTASLFLWLRQHLPHSCSLSLLQWQLPPRKPILHSRNRWAVSPRKFCRGLFHICRKSGLPPQCLKCRFRSAPCLSAQSYGPDSRI